MTLLVVYPTSQTGTIPTRQETSQSIPNRESYHSGLIQDYLFRNWVKKKSGNF